MLSAKNHEYDQYVGLKWQTADIRAACITLGTASGPYWETASRFLSKLSPNKMGEQVRANRTGYEPARLSFPKMA